MGQAEAAAARLSEENDWLLRELRQRDEALARPFAHSAHFGVREPTSTSLFCRSRIVEGKFQILGALPISFLGWYIAFHFIFFHFPPTSEK